MLPEPSHPLDIRMARLEGSYEQIDKRLDRVETNLARLEDKMEARFNQVDGRFNQAEANLARLEDKMETRFNQVENRFGQVDTKMDGLRTLIFLLFGALAGLVTVFEFVR